MKWRKAYPMNEVLLGLMAAWVIEEDTIIAAYAAANNGTTLAPARVKRLCQRVNQDKTQHVMAILARRALLDRSRPEVYSLGALARIIGGRNYKVVENALRKRLLPDLVELGWITGFVKKDPGDTKPFEISITEAGRDLYAQFLHERCFAEIAALLAELLDDDEDGA